MYSAADRELYVYSMQMKMILHKSLRCMVNSVWYFLHFFILYEESAVENYLSAIVAALSCCLVC